MTSVHPAVSLSRARTIWMYWMFAAGSQKQSVADDLDKVRGSPVLTVTDGAGPSTRGMVNFVLKSNRVRFEIDEASAAQSGLMISSKLLSLAAAVRPRS